MTLLSARGLEKSYGAVDIFHDINISIPPGARIAIVGPNGVGKTTLLRILIGLDEPSDGEISHKIDLKIGYLPQEAGISGENSLWDACLSVMTDLLELETKLNQLEKLMGLSEASEELLEEYGHLQEIFEQRGGYVYETRIKTVLTGLGFTDADYSRPLTQLSGGQRTRAYLARLLLTNPDLLILDEPTNHLDIAAVEWLEGYFRLWGGSILIVSHDRYFLDKVVDHIWEMRDQGIEFYRGNYSAYLVQRQERWELNEKIHQSEMLRLEKDLDYIKRNIAGQRVLHAKGKLRRLSREVEAIEQLGFSVVKTKNWAEISQLANISDHMMSVQELDQRIHSLSGPRRRPPQLHLKLTSKARSGDLVLRTRDLEIGYHDEGKPLFKCPDLLLKRGECAAVIGPNGAGKTTFLKTLLQIIPPYSGEILLGASLNIGYFAQAHEGLDPNKTAVQEIEASAPKMLLADIRNYLARYGFTGDEVFKTVGLLSGGERGRLALAKLSLTDANLLLLDEPTNHLDIPSQEILQEVLMAYNGTILLVSHDRYLIDALGTQIWEIMPDEFTLKTYEGTYSQYRAELEVSQDEKNYNSREAYKLKKQVATQVSNQDRKRKVQLKKLEEEIYKLEEELSALTKKLETPPDDPDLVQRLGEEYVATQESLNTLISEWETLHD